MKVIDKKDNLYHVVEIITNLVDPQTLIPNQKMYMVRTDNGIRGIRENDIKEIIN